MQHLAIIPDGNRRWAKKNKLKSFLGHKKGLEAFKETISFCIKNGIKHLSFYTFSLENFNRSDEEKNYLFGLIEKELADQIPDLIKNEIRIRFVGDSNYFPENIKPFIEKAESETKNFNKLNLNLLFCYGAKSEIVNAARDLARKAKAGVLDPDQIDEKAISNSLWTCGIPDPDLILRTSNSIRLSNFLLYQAAYSELMFLDCLWPEVTQVHLSTCLDKFKKVKRNFGY